jgi:hypothetical protein
MEDGAATAEDEEHREDRQWAQRDPDPWNEELAHASILAVSPGPGQPGRVHQQVTRMTHLPCRTSLLTLSEGDETGECSAALHRQPSDP